MPSFYSNTMVVLSVAFALRGANAQCSDPARPLARCCMGVAAWSTNSVVWGGICGYTPPSPSEIIGARCIINPGTWKLARAKRSMLPWNELYAVKASAGPNLAKRAFPYIVDRRPKSTSELWPKTRTTDSKA
ncbi:hypothetical protein BDN71DRAFT_1435685 [Pleurotus eryngii]|uniref:Uncharacterized protein n=1 Tax=Pleurotus eryngii TaxID=5323 RepID=A0A9P6D1P6_PLEER|nr:hypothetical protein BDN71DRAFT_1435685 [Pleurotus eryngii]